ncbi:uncharacterized protein F4812DRAFT_147873 [Daldinia caldariorum]|uniref:uncharacterized protein n=1 Tax=Daldinia caldariorum TaxID=326644 RepID=UPI0020081F52|nr:uncharacterized protein F4812DRAFT_147873 [Daldinia caldariorum]KAI1465012.1 hypothetical protein F4812DRAFT_147873 [Daldinia caldariorum]
MRVPFPLRLVLYWLVHLHSTLNLFSPTRPHRPDLVDLAGPSKNFAGDLSRPQPAEFIKPPKLLACFPLDYLSLPSQRSKVVLFGTPPSLFFLFFSSLPFSPHRLSCCRPLTRKILISHSFLESPHPKTIIFSFSLRNPRDFLLLIELGAFIPTTVLGLPHFKT